MAFYEHLCALCAGECRNAKARNVRWRFKSTCAHFAQEGAETRKHVTCDGVFKGTCARFAQASAETREHVTCDGVLKHLSTLTCCGARGIRAQGDCAQYAKRICARKHADVLWRPRDDSPGRRRRSTLKRIGAQRHANVLWGLRD
jgi:hypothetical protein